MLQSQQGSYYRPSTLQAKREFAIGMPFIRTIKPKYILFTSCSTIESLKISHLGFENLFDYGDSTPTPGSLVFRAPESFNHQSYDSSCNIWSTGVLLYLLLSGSPPFRAKTETEMKEIILNFKLVFEGPWANVTTEGKDLISKMLVVNPSKRISPYEALNDKWIIMHQNRNSILSKPMSIFSVNRLIYFEADAKIQQAATVFIVSQLVNSKEKESLQALFKEIDSNGDGQLSFDELYKGCKKIFGEQLHKEQLQAIFEKVDIDHNGTINYNEFMIATIDRSLALSEKNLKDAFDILDKGKKGFLYLEEIKDLVMEGHFIKEDQWLKIAKEADTNRDGKISFNEFVEMMRKCN